MDGTSDGAGSKCRFDGWYERWIREQVQVRWMVRAMEQGASERALDGTSDGSGSKCRWDGWYERWSREQVNERWMVQAMDRWIGEQAMDHGAIDGAMNDACDV